MKTLELLPPPEMMYRALVKRDPSFEGIFFVGVRTTGIFCRPTCSAKKPARKNVDFFATSSDALKRLSALLALPSARSKRASAETDRALARRSGARAGRTPHGQGTGRALDRSFNRAAAVQTSLRNDVSSLSSCGPDGPCLEPRAARRSRGSSEENGSGFESDRRLSRSIHEGFWRIANHREDARTAARRANRHATRRHDRCCRR